MGGEREDDIKVQIMRLIDGNPSVSQRELAQQLGLSVGKVNYLLKALIERGIVKAQNFRNSGNKVAYAYYLTPAGMFAKAALTRQFLTRKLVEYDALRAQIDALQSEVSAETHDAASRPRPANLTA